MKKILVILFMMTSVFQSCESWLDLVPEKDLTTINSVFERSKDATLFLYSIYGDTYRLGFGDLKNDPGMFASDEFVIGDFLRNPTYSNKFYLSGLRLTVGNNGSSNPVLPRWTSNSAKNYYYNIRNANILIDKIDGVYDMEQKEKNQYKAEAKALKAIYYFELMKYYGPICLTEEPISVEAEVMNMQMPRSPIDVCVDTIVSLFDQAIPHLLSQAEVGLWGRVTKSIAYSMKARTLLYAASPLFNGNEWYANFKNRDGELLFAQDYDLEKWHRAALAIDEALEYCENLGYELAGNTIDQATPLLNKIRDFQKAHSSENFDSKEIIYGVNSVNRDGGNDIFLKIPRDNTDHRDIRVFFGCVNPSLRMVELFYTSNGLPIDKDRTWDYNSRYQMGMETSPEYQNVVVTNKSILNLHLRREPRFYGSIAADGCYWKQGYFNKLVNAHKDGNLGTTFTRLISNEPQNLTGYYVKKMVHWDNNAGRYPNYNHFATYSKVRLADLYLMQAEAWNEYKGSNDKSLAALNKVRERAGIPTVQESWDNYSNEAGKYKNKDGLRQIIRQERNIEFAFEGHRYWDFKRWKIAHNYFNSSLKGWNVFGDNNESFYNNYDGPQVVWRRNKFISPRDYFMPIKDEEVLRANIVQNLGW